jgi:hypothetical protein
MYGDMSNRVVDAKHLLDQTSPDHVKQTSRHQQPVLASSEWQPTGHMPSAFGYGLPHNSLAAVHTSGHPEASVHHSSYRLTQVRSVLHVELKCLGSVSCKFLCSVCRCLLLLSQSAGPATFPKPAGNSTLPRHNTNAAPVAPTPKQHSSARLPPPWQRRPLVLILILALACMTMLSLHQHFALQHIAHKVSQHRLPVSGRRAPMPTCCWVVYIMRSYHSLSLQLHVNCNA